MTLSGYIAATLRAAILFHNFNISGIYRLGDLISQRIFITWVLSDIYLYNISVEQRGAPGRQKGHLLVFLEKWAEGGREIYHKKKNVCMALAFCAACKPDECMLTGALFVNSFSPQIKQPQGKSLNSSRSIYITGELKVNVIAELDGQDRKKKK